MVRNIFFVSLVGVCLAGCISGPKAPDRKFSEKLNSDAYETSDAVMGVPILKRSPHTRKISGKVLCGEGIQQRPGNHVKVTLSADDKVVASTSTGADGAYEMIASVLHEKSYKLAASGAKCGASSRVVSLKEDGNFDFVLRE